MSSSTSTGSTGSTACAGDGAACAAPGDCCATLDCGSDGLCHAHCVIGGQPISNGTVNPSNPCEICNVLLSFTEWSFHEDDSTANYPVCSAPGDPEQRCFRGTCAPSECHPPSGPPYYSSVPLGASCPWTSGICTSSGSCSVGCYIDGQFVPDFHSQAGNSCSFCDSSLTGPYTWNFRDDGSSCSEVPFGVCYVGTCVQSSCNIGGVAYAPGEQAPNSGCGICDPSRSTTDWSPISTTPGDTPCSSAEPDDRCFGLDCLGSCNIGGVAVAPMKAVGDQGCQGCYPPTSTSAASQLPDGTPCNGPASGTSGICLQGTCHLR